MARHIVLSSLEARVWSVPSCPFYSTLAHQAIVPHFRQPRLRIHHALHPPAFLRLRIHTSATWAVPSVLLPVFVFSFINSSISPPKSHSLRHITRHLSQSMTKMICRAPPSTPYDCRVCNRRRRLAIFSTLSYPPSCRCSRILELQGSCSSRPSSAPLPVCLTHFLPRGLTYLNLAATSAHPMIFNFPYLIASSRHLLHPYLTRGSGCGRLCLYLVPATLSFVCSACPVFPSRPYRHAVSHFLATCQRVFPRSPPLLSPLIPPLLWRDTDRFYHHPIQWPSNSPSALPPVPRRKGWPLVKSKVALSALCGLLPLISALLLVRLVLHSGASLPCCLGPLPLQEFARMRSGAGYGSFPLHPLAQSLGPLSLRPVVPRPQFPASGFPAPSFGCASPSHSHPTRYLRLPVNFGRSLFGRGCSCAHAVTPLRLPARRYSRPPPFGLSPSGWARTANSDMQLPMYLVLCGLPVSREVLSTPGFIAFWAPPVFHGPRPP